jgi:hypothetical protein
MSFLSGQFDGKIRKGLQIVTILSVVNHILTTGLHNIYQNRLPLANGEQRKPCQRKRARFSVRSATHKKRPLLSEEGDVGGCVFKNAVY